MGPSMTADTFVEITVAAPSGALHSARFAITDRRLTYEGHLGGGAPELRFVDTDARSAER